MGRPEFATNRLGFAMTREYCRLRSSSNVYRCCAIGSGNRRVVPLYRLGPPLGFCGQVRKYIKKIDNNKDQQHEFFPNPTSLPKVWQTPVSTSFLYFPMPSTDMSTENCIIIYNTTAQKALFDQMYFPMSKTDMSTENCKIIYTQVSS